jgi:hypothetical protein
MSNPTACLVCPADLPSHLDPSVPWVRLVVSVDGVPSWLLPRLRRHFGDAADAKGHAYVEYTPARWTRLPPTIVCDLQISGVSPPREPVEFAPDRYVVDRWIELTSAQFRRIGTGKDRLVRVLGVAVERKRLRELGLRLPGGTVFRLSRGQRASYDAHTLEVRWSVPRPARISLSHSPPAHRGGFTFLPQREEGIEVARPTKIFDDRP